jgi:hypothetical protein
MTSLGDPTTLFGRRLCGVGILFGLGIFLEGAIGMIRHLATAMETEGLRTEKR